MQRTKRQVRGKRRPAQNNAWSGRKSPTSKVHAQFNGNLRRFRAPDTPKKISPLSEMHPGLITQLLQGHDEPASSRRRSREDIGAHTIFTVSPQSSKMMVNSSTLPQREPALLESNLTGQRLEKDIKSKFERSQQSCGLMTRMLQHHSEPTVTGRRSAQKCLPSKVKTKMYDPEKGLLTSLFAMHKPRPRTGRRILSPESASGHCKPLQSGRRHFNRKSGIDEAQICIPQEPVRPTSASPFRRRGGRRSFRKIQKMTKITVGARLNFASESNPVIGHTMNSKLGQRLPVKSHRSIIS